MSAEQIIRDFFQQVWNDHKIDAVSRFLTADHVNHDPTMGDDFPQGIDGYKGFVSTFLSAFPNLHFDVHGFQADGDTVSYHWTAVGTQTGDLMGIPASGKTATVHGMNRSRILNGKVVETWAEWNPQDLMSQIGA